MKHIIKQYMKILGLTGLILLPYIVFFFEMQKTIWK